MLFLVKVCLASAPLFVQWHQMQLLCPPHGGMVRKNEITYMKVLFYWTALCNVILHWVI